ncbi:MAG TPA: hypothetical protein VG122_04770 [Gemmata sp.]|jgi:hypothetical protein|nr:hypothetical protein [Gemmata sp.]
MEPRATQVLVFLVSLLSATFAVLVWEGWSVAPNTSHAAEFHQLTGGIGSGTSTDISVCPAAFDARLDEGCRADWWPVPGGGCFCPAHAGPLLTNAPQYTDLGWMVESSSDAHSP